MIPLSNQTAQNGALREQLLKISEARAAPFALRVLFVIPGDGQSSSMIFVRRQAASVAREGAEVDCFYLRSRTSLRLLSQDFFALRARIQAFRPAVVHAHFGTVTAAVAALAAGSLPLVVTYRGGDLNPSPATPGLRAWCGRLLSQLAALRATRIVCVSAGLRERLWWRRSRVVVLPTGVDTDLFQPEPRDQARARIAWPLEDRVVLFNAGYDPRNKRLDLALKAAAVARRICPGLRLEILDGRADPRRIPMVMNACDCLLIASDWEGSPTVLQEALACAVPIVSVEVGDAEERLRGVANTRVVSRDPEVMGRALAELTASPRRTNGPAAAAELSLSGVARRLCGLYREALGSRAAVVRAAAAGN